MSLASEGDVSHSSGFIIRLLQVVRNTPGRQMSAQEVALVEIKAIHAEVKERYGSPRIHQELKKRGFKTSLNTVAEIIRKNHIQSAASSGFRICRTTTTVSPKPIKTDSSSN